MKGLRLSIFGLSLVVVLSVGFPGNGRAALFSDSFPGTSLNTANWSTIVLSGVSGQFTVNSGLHYSDSSGAGWTVLESTQGFSTNIDVVLQVSNFQSSTTYPQPYSGFPSAVGLGLGQPGNIVVAGLGGGPGDFFYFAAQFDVLTGTISGLLPFPTTATSGQLELSYVGSEVDAYFNGLKFASFFPGFGGPVPINISGTDIPTGATSFTVNSVSVSSNPVMSNVPLPPAFLFLGPGLVGLAALRRRFKS